MKKRFSKKLCIALCICLASTTIFSACSLLQGEKGDKGDQGIQGVQGLQGETGKDGVGIDKIEKSSTENNIDIYTIYLTDGTTATFSVTNGQSGENGENGTDGVSITNATVNEDQELVLSFSDETTLNLGKIVGENGIDGQNGISITGAEINEQDELVLSFSTGTPLNLGNVKGADGENGIGIASVEINEIGELTITLTDNTPIKLGKIIGENGKNGVSVSNVSLENCELTIALSDGTVYELGNIRGEKGDQGIQGEKGEDGAQGEQGIQGEIGKSAYELYQATYGYEGSEEEWLSDLVNGRLATLNTYTVTFNPNNGEEIFTQAISDGKKATAPIEPTKEGYDFLGWYVGDEKWSFIGYVVTEDIDLVAKWEETYTQGLDFYYLPDGTYGVKAGQAEYLEEIVIPSTYRGETVTRILPNAFKEMNITKITIPDSIRYIDTNAFNNCYKLEKISYIGEIDCWAQISFANREANPLCYAKKLYIKEELVTEVRITNATKISNYAFYNCEELKNLSIGDSVVSIGEYSFANTITLEKIIIPANVMEIQPYAFYGSGLKQAILENPTEWQLPTTFTYRYTQRDIRDYGREVTDTYSTRTYDISIPENAAMALCNEVTLQVGHTSLWYGDYGVSVQTDNFLWYTYKWTRLVEEIEE